MSAFDDSYVNWETISSIQSKHTQSLAQKTKSLPHKLYALDDMAVYTNFPTPTTPMQALPWRTVQAAPPPLETIPETALPVPPPPPPKTSMQLPTDIQVFPKSQLPSANNSSQIVQSPWPGNPPPPKPKPRKRAQTTADALGPRSTHSLSMKVDHSTRQTSFPDEMNPLESTTSPCVTASLPANPFMSTLGDVMPPGLQAVIPPRNIKREKANTSQYLNLMS